MPLCFEAEAAAAAAEPVALHRHCEACEKLEKDLPALSSCFFLTELGGSWRVFQVRLCLDHPVLSVLTMWKSHRSELAI